jgi:hypothetical protein
MKHATNGSEKEPLQREGMANNVSSCCIHIQPCAGLYCTTHTTSIALFHCRHTDKYRLFFTSPGVVPSHGSGTCTGAFLGLISACIHSSYIFCIIRSSEV